MVERVSFEGANSRRAPISLPSSSLSNLQSQRSAVAELRERQRRRVNISSQRFGEGRLLNTRVVIDGEFYDVSQPQLIRLQAGTPPAELALDAVDCDDDC